MKRSLTIIAAAVLLLACNKLEPGTDTGYGEISVSLGEPEVELTTKAGTLLQSDGQAAAYIVTIFNASGVSQYSSTYDKFEPQVLPFGRYYVTAENCSEAGAETGNGQMRLFGQSSVLTISEETLSQTATVDCTVQNAKLTVAFDSSVAGKFENLEVTLSRNAAPERTLTIAQSVEETVTWFNPSSVAYSITGTFKSGGITKPVSMNGSLSLEKKNNVRLLVKLNLDSGQMVLPSITFDTTIDSPTDVEQEFNPYE